MTSYVFTNEKQVKFKVTEFKKKKNMFYTDRNIIVYNVNQDTLRILYPLTEAKGLFS